MSLVKFLLVFFLISVLLLAQEDFVCIYENGKMIAEVPSQQKKYNLVGGKKYHIIKYQQVHTFSNLYFQPGTTYRNVKIEINPYNLDLNAKEISGVRRDVNLYGVVNGGEDYLLKVWREGFTNAQTTTQKGRFRLQITNAPGRYNLAIFTEQQNEEIFVRKEGSRTSAGIAFIGVEKKEITINFHDMELLGILNYFSQEFGITFIVNDKSLGKNNLKSKITIINAKPVKDSQEAFAVLKAALALQNIGLVRQGNLWKVVSLEQAVRSGHEVKGNNNIDDLLRTTTDDDSVVTRVIPLEYVNALKAVVIVKNLISRDGKVNQTDASNIIVVTDYSSNVRKVLQILSAVDVPVTKEYVAIYSLKHIESSRLEKIFTPIFGKTQKKVVRIIPIANKKLVVALADQWNHQRIREILSQIDTPNVINQEIFVYQVQHNVAEKLAETGNKIYQKAAEENQAAFYADTFTNMAVIRCSPNMYQAQILPLLQKLDVSGGSTQRFIYHLQYASARDLADRLTKIYTNTNAQIKITIIANEQTNSLIISCAEQDYQEIHSMIEELDINANSDISGDYPQTYVIRLSHANAEDIAKQLNQMYANTNTQGGRQGSQRGVSDESYYFPIRIVANKTTNSLLLFCTPSDFANIRKTIAKVDIETQQVLIDINIIEAVVDDALNLGVEWQFNDGNQSAGTNFNLDGLGNRNKLSLNDAASAATGFQYNAIINDRYEVFANLFAGTSEVKVLSSPKIYTANNEEAKIIVGEEVPIVTRRINNPDFNDNNVVQDFEYREVGLITKLTPTINNRNEVTIKVTQEISNIRSTAQADAPIISKREITTHVRIKDGQTVILGGLFDTIDETQINRVPFLGDIPLLGHLFRTQTSKEIRKELLVFVTPKVINKLEDSPATKQSDTSTKKRRWKRKRRD